MKRNILEYDPVQAVSFIISYEGFRSSAYKDPLGIWTIGYGHTKGVKEGDTVSRLEASELLANDLKYFQDDLAALVKVPVGLNQFIALMSFIYNFGLTKCRNYSLFTELNKGNYLQAARKFSDYRNPGSNIEKGLLKRRLAEAVLFLKDENLRP